MGIRDQPGTFPVSAFGPNIGGHGYNVSDTVGVNANVSLRSAGAALIATPALSPGVSDHWKIRSLSVSGILAMLLAQTGGGRPVTGFGKFGRIMMGILPSPVLPSPPANFAPAAQYWTPLPHDTSLFTPMWDPSVDDMPPQYNGSGNTLTTPLPISGGLSLPQDRPLDPGTNIGIGIWLLPSVLGTYIAGFGSMGLTIYDATYTITYDDGR